MLVKNLMTRNVLACLAEDTLERAAQLMWEGDVGCVPVVDERNQVIGMVTDRDICMAAYTRGTNLASCTVAGAMSKQVHTCSPEDSLSLAEERMRQKQVRRLPVVEGRRLVGLLSMNDLANAASNRKGSRSSGVGFEEVVTTLSRIGEHRAHAASAAQ